jgi:acetolactate synthase I/II/III large subunit
MPSEGIVALDNGMHKIWLPETTEPMWRTRYRCPMRWPPWGAGLPSATMAAMLLPERRVLAVCGDGGFMTNSQEMETAVRLKLNLVILILEDSAYGMIRWKQAVDHFPNFGLTFFQDRKHGLERAFEAGGVHLVSIPID